MDEHLQCAGKGWTNISERRHLVFDHTDLTNWKEVALRVLATIGWEESCVYEDALYPMTDKMQALNWELINRTP